MSIVLIGGNKRMESLYIDICEDYGYRVKAFNQMHGELRRKIGTPDLIVLFTGTVSHKMADCARCEAKRCSACIYHCHDSVNALDSLLKSCCPGELK